MARSLQLFVVAAWPLWKHAEGSQQCEVLEDTDYEGTDYWWELGLTREECCHACEKEPNCSVAVFFGAGCYLKDSSASTASQVAGRCSMRPKRVPARELMHPKADKDALSFCAKGFCRRDAVRQGALALASSRLPPEECVRLSSMGSGDEKTEAVTPWRTSMINAEQRKADLVESGYHTGRCDRLQDGDASARSILQGAVARISTESCSAYGCGSFEPSRGCQCAPSCRANNNCCSDYEAQCEAAEETTTSRPSTAAPTSTTATPSTSTTAAPTTTTTTAAPTSTTTAVQTTAAPTAPSTAAAAPAPSTSTVPAVEVTAPAPATSEVPPMASSQASPATTPPAKPPPETLMSHTPAPPPVGNAGSCHVYGCLGYHEDHACQCNALCTRYNNCCADYSTTCTQSQRTGESSVASAPAAAPPPASGDDAAERPAPTAEPQASSSPRRSCKIEQDTEYVGGTGEEMGTVEGMGECARVCVSMPDCTHFSINVSQFYKICVVKRSEPREKERKPGVVSGVCGSARKGQDDPAPPAQMPPAAPEPVPKADPAQPPPASAPSPLVHIDIFRAMKAAAADDQESLDDDMADILGDVKYVHTELLTEHLLDPARQSRKYDIDCIRKQRYVFRNPAALVGSGQSPLQDFGPFVTYDFGVATNPDQVATLQRYGDFIGIQEGCSGGYCDVRFPSEDPYYWFSVGNFCPNLPWGQKGEVDNPAEDCMQYEEGGGFLTGGLCENGWSRGEPEPAVQPTGERGCTYSCGASQVVDLDQFVGIVSESCGDRKCAGWSDFRENCADESLKRQFDLSGEIKQVPYCVEYDIHPYCEANCNTDKCQDLIKSGRIVELGLPFWSGRCSARANVRRAEKLAHAFGIDGALTEHRLIDKGVLDKHATCLREGDSRCRPGLDAGGPYCTRAFAGVCQSCFIPGAVHGAGAVKPFCPLDILKSADYNDTSKHPVPKCKSDKASDGCCLYTQSCEGDPDPARAAVDDDGYALVAARRDSSDMAAFLKRAAEATKKNGIWQKASDEMLQQAAYHQWSQSPTGRTLDDALAEAEQLLEELGKPSKEDRIMFKKFLMLHDGSAISRGPYSALLAVCCALMASAAACTVGRLARNGRRPLYMEVQSNGVPPRSRGAAEVLLPMPHPAAL